MKIYGAGIMDANCNWLFQGTVVAKNIKDAKKLVVAYKKKKGLIGSSEVANFGKFPTKRKPGVYNTATNLGTPFKVVLLGR